LTKASKATAAIPAIKYLTVFIINIVFVYDSGETVSSPELFKNCLLIEAIVIAPHRAEPRLDLAQAAPKLVAMRLLLFLLLLASAMPHAAGGQRVYQYLDQPPSWFLQEEGTTVIRNVLLWQTPRGDWPKNVDTSAAPPAAARSLEGTFDNGATTGELRFLALAVSATQREDCRAAFYRGLDHVLEAQYPTGGWPQSYPPGKGYPRHITFNDDAMVRILRLLKDVSEADSFRFTDATHRQSARAAFRKGIACIVRCQVRIHGKPTVWCAQHDEVTLEPRGARTYELPSLSGSESAGILLLLMSLPQPDKEVVEAVRAGVEWFRSARITGIRVEKVNGNKEIRPDPAAPPLWARFYDLDSGKPFFGDRDGVKKWNLADIGAERRNGYAWYGNWGDSVEKAYRGWLADSR
jgi:pectate lyase